MAIRNVILIDEDKCDGCGECVPACEEGAIQIVDGKASLVSDVYCDGLGACLGECPQGAITIEEREAAEFDPEAVRMHLEVKPGEAGEEEELACGCPGTMTQVIERCELQDKVGEPGEKAAVPSRLGNWPVQIMLLPASAPYLDGAKLLIAADCVPFSLADFHDRFLADRILLVGCPKLDNADFYRRKLAQIFIQNDIKSVDVVYMEVPCCFGIVHIVHESLKESGKDIPLTFTKIGIKGDVIETARAGEGSAL
ncbi:MAG: 4Fe-4S binding protein [Actinobacteria bacterium]|nr:4Fe-4S binding protein [Actinomycetota bacterium]MCG2796125.1 4Fe-4S binding protein [Actinomycetes bacterium]